MRSVPGAVKVLGIQVLPLFWTIEVERHGILNGPLMRNSGLTQFFGGNAELARIMGADEDLTKTVMKPIKFSICESCATEHFTSVMEAVENAGEEDVEEDEDFNNRHIT